MHTNLSFFSTRREAGLPSSAGGNDTGETQFVNAENDEYTAGFGSQSSSPLLSGGFSPARDKRSHVVRNDKNVNDTLTVRTTHHVTLAMLDPSCSSRYADWAGTVTPESPLLAFTVAGLFVAL